MQIKNIWLFHFGDDIGSNHYNPTRNCNCV